MPRILLAHNSRKRGKSRSASCIMTDAEPVVRFLPIHIPLFFTPDVILVSHFILLFTTMAVCLLLWSLGPTHSLDFPSPRLLSSIIGCQCQRNSYAGASLMAIVMPCRRRTHPSFVIVSRFIYFDASSISSTIILISSLPDSQLNGKLRFYAQEFQRPFSERACSQSTTPMVNPDASPHANRLA